MIRMVAPYAQPRAFLGKISPSLRLDMDAARAARFFWLQQDTRGYSRQQCLNLQASQMPSSLGESICPL